MISPQLYPYFLHDLVRVTNHVGRINRFWTWLTNPSDLWVRVTFPYSASVHNISDRSLRWYTVQVPTQLTTTMSCYIAILDQPQPRRLAHISESLNGLCLQGYCKYGGILPCRPTCSRSQTVVYSPPICPVTHNALTTHPPDPSSMYDGTPALTGPHSKHLPPGGRAAVTPPLRHPTHWKAP